MKKYILPLIAIAVFAAGCDSSQPVAGKSYDDGIYHDPAKDGNTAFSLNDIKKEEEVTTNPDASANGNDIDYYNPDDNNSNYSTGTAGGTVINNYYGPSYRYPGVNTGMYWNSWGGFGMSVGIGWGSPYFYDPFFYDPWYSPWGSPYGYYGWRSPYYGWGYSPYWGGYGAYNSYWAGYYQGYYYGSGGFNDVGSAGRNVVYVRNASTASRTNSFNSVNRNTNMRKSTADNGSGRNISRNSAGRSASTQNPSRKVANREVASSSRFTDRNLAENTVSSRSGAISRTPSAASRTYRSSSYDVVSDRASTSRDRQIPVATENRTRAREVESQRSNTRSYPKEGYTPDSRSRTTTPARSNDRPNTNTRSRSEDIYVPSEQRNQNYTPRNNTPSRSRDYTPSRSESPSRTTTPSRSNTPSRSYTPSSTPSRSYTPSRSSTPSRSYTPSTPSRSYTPSSSPSRGGSSTPSRSGGGRR